MEDIATRCLKYGDTIYLKTDGKQAFVSAHDRATPQVGCVRTPALAGGSFGSDELSNGLVPIYKVSKV
jgi:hypothetical protein